MTRPCVRLSLTCFTVAGLVSGLTIGQHSNAGSCKCLNWDHVYKRTISPEHIHGTSLAKCGDGLEQVRAFRRPETKFEFGRALEALCGKDPGSGFTNLLDLWKQGHSNSWRNEDRESQFHLSWVGLDPNHTMDAYYTDVIDQWKQHGSFKKGDASWNKTCNFNFANHGGNDVEDCHDFGQNWEGAWFNQQKHNFCQKVNSKGIPGDYDDKDWCYVDAGCPALNGGAQVSGQLSWKLCGQGDHAMRDMPIEDVLKYADAYKLSVQKAALMAYPLHTNIEWATVGPYFMAEKPIADPVLQKRMRQLKDSEKGFIIEEPGTMMMWVAKGDDVYKLHPFFDNTTRYDRF